MSPIEISAIAWACIFGGALLGMRLRSVLPEHHVSAESKNVINLGAGIIGTMAALALGLLVASAKSHYDTQSNEVTDVATKIVLLDRVLAHYGPEANEVRDALRSVVTRTLKEMWAKENVESPRQAGGDLLFDRLQELSPKDDNQRSLKADALNLTLALGQTRWLMFTQKRSSISKPLLVMMVFWLTINFVSFGLFAPRNLTVLTTLFLCAAAVSGAVFFILEMYEPFTGLFHISDAPLRTVLAQLGH